MVPSGHLLQVLYIRILHVLMYLNYLFSCLFDCIYQIKFFSELFHFAPPLGQNETPPGAKWNKAASVMNTIIPIRRTHFLSVVLVYTSISWLLTNFKVYKPFNLELTCFRVEGQNIIVTTGLLVLEQTMDI